MLNEKKDLREKLDKAVLDGDSFLASWYGSELQQIYVREQYLREKREEIRVKFDSLRLECDSKEEDLATQIRIFGKIVYGR